MPSYDYDLFVIGGGSGGVRTARMSAIHGAKVAIAEEYRMGGTCVIRGCIPKKLFVYASAFSETFEDAAGFGWDVGETSFDWKTLVANKDREIARLEGIYTSNLEKAGVEIFEDSASLVDPHTIHLKRKNETVTAKYIVIATGGHPRRQYDLRGHEIAITSNEAFHLNELPKRIAIAGAGYIAIEFAGIFHGLGVETTIIYRGPKILREFDDDLRDAVEAAYRAKGIRILYHQIFQELARSGDHIKATTSAGEVLETDMVMFCVGRDPNTAALDLENAGVKLDAHGAINVNEYSQSNVENIYAIGDVTNRMQLTPVAIQEGAAVAETLFNGRPTSFDYKDVPTAVFSHPDIGTVGFTEAQARDSFANVDIYKSSFRPLFHTLSGRDQKMMMKMVVDADSDRVIGCHIFGADAAEMAQLAAVAIKMGATKADFDATTALHPSAAEELVTMREKWKPQKAKAAE